MTASVTYKCTKCDNVVEDVPYLVAINCNMCDSIMVNQEWLFRDDFRVEEEE